MKSLVYETGGMIKDLKKASEQDDSLKLEYNKIKKEFDMCVQNFGDVTKASADRQRSNLLSIRQDTKKMEQQRSNFYSKASGGRAGGDDLEAQTTGGGEGEGLLASAKKQEIMALDNEIAHNESIIAEREDEIREIENTMREVNDIFKDLAVMVEAQGEQIDVIETNVQETAAKTKKADEELTKANKYQKGAAKKICLILVILAVVAVAAVIAIVVVAKVWIWKF